MTLLTDSFTAYLGPLLKKHANGEALVLEDLEASRAAANKVIATSENSFVLKRLEDLHQSQLQAYREAATAALREWAATEAPLQPMEDSDTQHSFVERCVNAVVASSWPNWRIPTAKLVVSMEIRQRARTIYAKYHVEDTAPVEGDTGNEQAKNDAAQVSNDDDNADENEEEVEDEGEGEGDVDDGEMDDEDDEEDGHGEDEATPAKPGNNLAGAQKKKPHKKKKVVVRRKGTVSKLTNQNRKGPNARSRRGGRGGGAAGPK